MTNGTGQMSYRLGAIVAIATAFAQVWMNLAVGIVGDTDNPQNAGFFGVVVTAAACAFVARFRADGMARAMIATAAVQALFGLMVATAPITARVDPMGASGAVILTVAFSSMWLLAAALFHRSARQASLKNAAY